MADTKYTPLSPTRRAIASRMVEAIQTIPHFRLSVTLKVDSLLRRKVEINTGNLRPRVTLNDLLVKACATALVVEPTVNLAWDEDRLVSSSSADIAVVMSGIDGVAAPVVRNADKKAVEVISQEIRELAAKVRTKTLTMRELQGGTFSVSNLGMYGIERFDAIINAPQCAILAIGRVRQRLALLPTGELSAVEIISATLSADHRAVDGVGAARFLTALKQVVESPESVAAL